MDLEISMREIRKQEAVTTLRDRTIYAGVAGLVLLGGVALTGCEKKPAAPPPGAGQAMPVSVVKVKQTDVPISNEWVGTLDGYVNAVIQPQAAGYLVQQLYREGSQVTKGQVLFQIDQRPFQAVLDQAEGQVAQAKGQVAQAQAQLGLAIINVNRDTPLAEAHAIAKSQLDNDTQTKAQAEAAVASAEASVKAAEATVETAKLNLGFTHVRSLITGVAGQATTQVGNLVSTQSTLTSVSQLNPIKAYFSISDSEYLALVDKAHAGGGDLLKGSAKVPLTLTLANGTEYPSKGHIEYVDRQLNAQTGAIRIAAVFPNPGNVLRPGQFGRVKADTDIRRNGLLIPQIAVTELQGLHQVYVAGSDGKAHITTVTLDRQIGTDWLVGSGVKEGDQVIVDNLQKLRDGAPVAPHEGKDVAPTATTAPSAGR
jgi:membrane fusion protein (multidrug efflux system)